MSRPARLTGSFGALRERPFRLLWIGQATSALGDAMTPVALIFGVLEAGGSAGDLGLVFAAFTVAHAMFILAGGVWSDRLERRLVMLTCDVVRCAVQATLAVLVITGEARLWQFIVLATVVGAADSFFSPASIGLIPQTVSAELLQQANGLIAMTRSGTWIFGPALSGVIVAAAGAGWVFAIDAATFAVSAAFLWTLRVAPSPVAERQTFLADLVHGWRAVRARRWLWASLLGFGIGNLAWSAQGVLGPVIVKDELGGASSWGLILTFGGIGGVLGGVVALRWRPERPLLVSHAVIILITGYVLFFVPPAPVPLLAVASFVSIGSIVLGNTLWETVLQSEIPPETLSRVSSYDWAISLVFMPAGFAAWGPLSEWIGIDTTLIAAAGVVAATKLALVAMPEVRALRRREPTPEPALASDSERGWPDRAPPAPPP
jgi:MFS family permease